MPHVFLLACENQGTEGIPTVFVDTREIVDRLGEPELNILKGLELVYRNKDHTDLVLPVIKPHSQTQEDVLYLSYSRAYVRPQKDKLDNISIRDMVGVTHEVYRISDLLVQEHIWRSGQVVIFDNEALLHGRGLRTRFESDPTATDPTRRLHRIWMHPRAK